MTVVTVCIYCSLEIYIVTGLQVQLHIFRNTRLQSRISRRKTCNSSLLCSCSGPSASQCLDRQLAELSIIYCMPLNLGGVAHPYKRNFVVTKIYRKLKGRFEGENIGNQLQLIIHKFSQPEFWLCYTMYKHVNLLLKT